MKGLNVSPSPWPPRMDVGLEMDFSHQGPVSESVMLTQIIKPL